MPPASDEFHDLHQSHLMIHANRLHEMSSRNLHDRDNLAAVIMTVKHINETVDLLTALGHTPAEPASAETQDGLHIYG
jgi:predicted RNase H-like nuclease (RuvC/YqgF family)